MGPPKQNNYVTDLVSGFRRDFLRNGKKFCQKLLHQK